MAGIIDLHYDEPVWCSTCHDTGEFEDDEGFVTDCHCMPENDEPWLVPAHDAQGRRAASEVPAPVLLTRIGQPRQSQTILRGRPSFSPDRVKPSHG